MQQYEPLVELPWVYPLVTEITIWPKVNSRYILQMSEEQDAIYYLLSFTHILCDLVECVPLEK